MSAAVIDPPTVEEVTPGGDLALVAVRIASIVLTAASSAVVARSLGPHDYGVFAAGAAVASVIVLMRAFGADALYLRGSMDGRTLRRRSALAALVNVGLVAVAGLTWPGLSWTARGCELLMGTAWAIAWGRVPWFAVPARKLQFQVRARRELLSSALSLGGVMVLAAALHKPLWASAGLLIGTVLAVGVSWPSLSRETHDFSTPSGDATLRAGLVLAAIEGLFVAYFTVDGAMVAAMRSAVDAGMYRVAYAFVIAAAVVPVALNGDVLRVRLWQLDGEERRKALRRAVRLTAAAGVLVTLAFELLGGIGERLFFGSAFAAAIPIIRLLGAAMPFHYANSVLSNLLVGTGRIAAVIRTLAAMLVVNVAGNLYFISAYGPKGAAAMTAITEAFGLLVFTWLTIRARATR